MAQDEPPREPTPVERERRRMQVDGVAFGRRMREQRKKRGWSVHDLHDLTGVAASTISELERGRTVNPDPWVTHSLAVAMGCPSAGDMLAWLEAREKGEPYEPEGGRGTPFGPARLVGPKGAGDVRLDVLVEQLLRGVVRAMGPTAVAVTVALGEGAAETGVTPPAPFGAQPALPGAQGPLIVLAVGNFFGGLPTGVVSTGASGGAERRGEGAQE